MSIFGMFLLNTFGPMLLEDQSKVESFVGVCCVPQLVPGTLFFASICRGASFLKNSQVQESKDRPEEEEGSNMIRWLRIKLKSGSSAMFGVCRLLCSCVSAFIHDRDASDMEQSAPDASTHI